MGNIVRLVIIVVNIISFLVVKEEDAILFVSYLILFNSLTFPVFYFFDFRSPFIKISQKYLTIENEIKDTDIKIRTFKEMKYSLGNVFNWITLLFPLAFLFFVEEHNFTGLYAIFSLVIFLNLLFNIMILSILIRNYYLKYYVLYIILIGIIFLTYNAVFELTKMNLLWFSVFLILLTYVLMVSLVYYIKHTQLQN
jgi:hypothetical protein